MNTVFFQLVLVVHGIKPVPGKAVEFPDQNDVKQFFVAVLNHLLELRTVIRLGRDGSVNVMLDNGDTVLLCISRTFTNLAFDRFFTLVVRGIAGIDHSGHGKHLTLHIIKRRTVLSKSSFV